MTVLGFEVISDMFIFILAQIEYIFFLRKPSDLIILEQTIDNKLDYQR